MVSQPIKWHWKKEVGLLDTERDVGDINQLQWKIHSYLDHELTDCKVSNFYNNWEIRMLIVLDNCFC